MLYVSASSPVIEGVITRERLHSYISVFSCTNDSEAMGAYYWNVAMCSALYGLITAAELAIRNSVDKALWSNLGAFWWKGQKLHYKTHIRGKSPPDAVKKLQSNFEKAFKSAKKDKRERYQNDDRPKHPEVVAKTDFSTWEHVLNEEFLGPDLIWPKHLRKVFKGQWPDPSDKTTLRFAREAVADIRLFRNRVHHNEPAWKAFGVHNADDATRYIRGKIEKIIDLLDLIEPAQVGLLKQSGVLAHAHRIATVQEVQRYQRHSVPLNIKPTGKISKLFAEDRAGVAVVRARTKRLFLVQPL